MYIAYMDTLGSTSQEVFSLFVACRFCLHGQVKTDYTPKNRTLQALIFKTNKLIICNTNERTNMDFDKRKKELLNHPDCTIEHEWLLDQIDISLEEEFERDKFYLMNDIKKSKDNLNLFQRCKNHFGKQWQETIDLEQDWFNSLLKALVALKRKNRK